ncbi:MAG: thioredoxin family protein [Saprospiraceae bacterium]|nr:thioredoxin family protein [Saprospiraceae bacterium]
MSLTESNMLKLGIQAPDFNLPNVVNGNLVSLSAMNNYQAYVIFFICNHCPYVIHINPELIELCKEYLKKNVCFIGISSNDILKYPQDGPEKMREHAIRIGYPFPYLYDETQEVAKAYDAACTPDFYIFDNNKILEYRGRLDASRPNSGTPVTGEDLRNALDAVLANQPVDSIQYPSMGCNIKWK